MHRFLTRLSCVLLFSVNFWATGFCAVVIAVITDRLPNASGMAATEGGQQLGHCTHVIFDMDGAMIWGRGQAARGLQATMWQVPSPCFGMRSPLSGMPPSASCLARKAFVLPLGRSTGSRYVFVVVVGPYSCAHRARLTCCLPTLQRPSKILVCALAKQPAG
jgi:hypothetical protein